MAEKGRKDSYTIPCASDFRDAVQALARRRKVNVADLARSVLLVLPPEVVRGEPDPGGPKPGDREEIRLKSGPATGKPWRRKPRLQMRLAPGHDTPTVRRALGLALRLEDGAVSLCLEKKNGEADQVPDHLKEELDRLRTVVSILSFDPLINGVGTREEALHVLGFPPTQRPSAQALRQRFRMLATIHHPDSNFGSHQRMSQLNAAMDILRG